MLAIESSCDETAAALVEETGSTSRPWAVRSSIVASQVDIHRSWGGVVPELASRQHVRDICGVVERALADGDASWPAVDAVAVTQGPGLVGSLVVGLAFAKAVASAHEKPCVAVHHLAGHIESLWLAHGQVPLPAVVLVVSGGHTNLYLVPRVGEYHLLGRTRDDAAGEAYDKVAKLLGLDYPGGPLVDRLAASGTDTAVEFPLTRLTSPDRNAPDRDGRLDFSFSGLKTSVLRHVRARQAALGVSQLPAADVADICASFQRSVIHTLSARTFEAAKMHGAQAIGVAGGVSANRRLRAEFDAHGRACGIPVLVPPMTLSTDNAAMIGAAGLRAYRAGRRTPLDAGPMPAFPLG